MKIRKFRYFVGDFETTVYDGQQSTEVWASAVVELGSENVEILHSIDETFNYLIDLNDNIMIYYHNLKFDGTFWLDYLIKHKHFSQAVEKVGERFFDVRFLKEKDMQNNTFKYSISDMGAWYNIIIKVNNHIIEIRDSLKLLPFSVRKIGKSFGTKHKKLDMEYTGYRYAGCEITDEEKSYIANDVLVIKEALEIMFDEGHKKLTIGSCCLSEFQKIVNEESVSNEIYSTLYPNLYEIEIPEHYGSTTVGDYINKSYKGGWCYAVTEDTNKVVHNGVTADVNSLYPSMMHSESGNIYPTGVPTFYDGESFDRLFPLMLKSGRKYCFIRLKTRFYLKDGYLPFIQIKRSWLYNPRESLKTSDVYNDLDGNYYRQYIDLDGNMKEAIVELTLTQTDYLLMLEHYNLEDTTILDWCVFDAEAGQFDKYIDKYKQIKITSKGAKRELAKLFLNNLYGKMASNTRSDFKVCYVKDDGNIGFVTVIANDKKPGYIAIGSAITSYARNFTIRHAQMNFHGVGKPGFKYADTDSIHCDIPVDNLIGIDVHPTNFCCWKLESYWDFAMFTRQKTYIEHITHENGDEVKPHYLIKCAGMPEKCKRLFELSMTQDITNEDKAKLSQKEQDIIDKHYTINDFTVGLELPGKLLPKIIDGGTLLTETTYKMRGKKK